METGNQMPNQVLTMVTKQSGWWTFFQIQTDARQIQIYIKQNGGTSMLGGRICGQQNGRADQLARGNGKTQCGQS
eukprot:6904264-Karenia_brevis.AAC.1